MALRHAAARPGWTRRSGSYQSREERNSEVPEVIVQQAAVHHVPEDGDASGLTQRVSCRDTSKTSEESKAIPQRSAGIPTRTGKPKRFGFHGFSGKPPENTEF